MEISKEVEIGSIPGEQPEELLLVDSPANDELAAAITALALAEVVFDDETEEVTDEVELILNPDTKESLTSQLSNSYEAYREVVNDLNNEYSSLEQLTPVSQKIFASEFAAWLSDEQLGYIQAAQEADPSLTYSTLVATPNITMTQYNIVSIARAFYRAQPKSIYLQPRLYSQYSAEELSGTNPENGNAVLFSLFPNKTNDRLYGTVDHQVSELISMKEILANLRVPSVFEAIVHWYTLRASSVPLTGSAIIKRTLVRHFDLPKLTLDSEIDVLRTYLHGVSRPFINHSRAASAAEGLVVIG